jgi:hypothetical protein
VVEEGALAPVSKPGEARAHVGVVSGRSQSDLLNHRMHRTPPLVEEGALAPVSKPGEARAYVGVVSRRSLRDLLNHRRSAG